jgi:hypothetical protein
MANKKFGLGMLATALAIVVDLMMVLSFIFIGCASTSEPQTFSSVPLPMTRSLSGSTWIGPDFVLNFIDQNIVNLSVKDLMKFQSYKGEYYKYKIIGNKLYVLKSNLSNEINTENILVEGIISHDQIIIGKAIYIKNSNLETSSVINLLAGSIWEFTVIPEVRIHNSPENAVSNVEIKQSLEFMNDSKVIVSRKTSINGDVSYSTSTGTYFSSDNRIYITITAGDDLGFGIENEVEGMISGTVIIFGNMQFRKIK